MTQIPSTNGVVCEEELQVPCKDGNVLYCGSICYEKYRENYMSTECVEKFAGNPICVCIYKSEYACPPNQKKY